MSEEEAYEFVKNTLKQERIVPYTRAELDVIRSVEQCINCGLCINHCPVVRTVGLDRFSGPRSIAVELSRSPPEFWAAVDKIYLCTGCGTCREICPKNVNIPEVVNIIRARLFNTRPDLVPKSLMQTSKIIATHNLAFEPWEDPEDKADSRDMRLEMLGLPLIEDRIVKGADVLFYPGCQAEERAQEVREAGKIILDHFGVDYTLLEEMSCCGLPARLIGDTATAEHLADILTEKVKTMGVKSIVTTCAGCTSSLSQMAEEREWNIPVYHMMEYLVEVIGIDRVREAITAPSTETEPQKVTLHNPCHLIRHTSRQMEDYAREILTLLPTEYVSSSVADSCCGGGGMVGYHSPDVANAVTQVNVGGIKQSGAAQLVAPCPLCTAQIENALFRVGSEVEVSDFTVFLAQHLRLKR
ncbi:MAG: (Fe-S)-binding protein [Candidatus Thorarchaeota archaeon]